jgi:hypothetical protein
LAAAAPTTKTTAAILKGYASMLSNGSARCKRFVLWGCKENGSTWSALCRATDRNKLLDFAQGAIVLSPIVCALTEEGDDPSDLDAILWVVRRASDEEE